jgi:hypothetical protein
LPILTLTGHYFASAALGVQKILDMMVPPTGEAIVCRCSLPADGRSDCLQVQPARRRATAIEKSLCAGEMTAHRRGASEH